MKGEEPQKKYQIVLIIAALQFFVNMEDSPTKRIISIMSHMFHLDFMPDGFGKRIVVGTGIPKSG